MTLDETEITRIRYEDLDDSLKELIDNIILYDDPEYITLRTRVAEMSGSINTSNSIHVGAEAPKTISLGNTVFFSSSERVVKIANSNGDWVYLN